MTFKEAVPATVKVIMFIAVMAFLLFTIYCLADKIEVDRQVKLKTEKEHAMLEKKTFEKRQEKIGDSLSVYFMKTWDSLKDTPEFKNCRYETFRVNMDFGEHGWKHITRIDAKINCTEIKDLPPIGPFTPTAMVPGYDEEVMSVIYKYFPKGAN